MNRRTTWILLLIVAALGGYIRFVERRSETTEQRRDAVRHAFHIQPEQVRRMRIEQGEDVLECAREGDRWFLSRPVRAPADAGAIQRILFELESLPRSSVVTAAERAERGQTLADYGLEPARAVFTLEGEGGALSFRVGRPTPLGRLFLQEEGRDDLVTTSTNLLALIPADPSVLRDRSLFRGDPLEVKRIQVRRNDGFLQLMRGESGGWMVQQPVLARADATAVESLVDALLRIRAESFVRDGATDPAPYGFEETAAVEATLDFDRADAASFTLQIGRALEKDPGLLYARIKGQDTIVAVARAALDPLDTKVELLRDRRLAAFDAAQVQAITIERGDRSLRLEKHDGGWSLVQPSRTDADNATVEDLLREWRDLRIEHFSMAETNRTVVGLDPPYARLVFDLNPPATPAHAAGTADAVHGDPATPALPLCEIRIGGRPQTNGWVAAQFCAEPPALIRPVLPWLTAPDPLLYRSRQVLRLVPDDVRSLLLERGDSKQKVECDEKGLFLPPPGTNAIVNASGVRLRVEELSRLRAEGLVTENTTALAEYGLDRPAATLTVTLRGEQGIAKVLMIGRSSPAGVYAMIRGQNLVFLLDPALAGRLQSDLYTEPPPAAGVVPPPPPK